MTLEEKIEQEKLQIEENWEKLAYAATLDNQHLFDTCLQNIKEHEQLVEWLEELKKRRSEDYGYMADIHQGIGYRKAIDDFAEKFIYKAVCEGCSGCCNCYEEGRQNECEDYKSYMTIAEQLKEAWRK